ncbi:hypothetical protein BGI41_02060 [Methanobrevibacter sp. 87.7]|uniref:beta strand repeat-containing protein n=1 Tax=Methanobrevibacter sp. 87.7 TaxID=387957 RepID=UPI000B512363|nr:Ig-like domain-containing protein [Methanobrevibacter sp. 87.7]OWT33503.1 hypothetical protein BGI41_02060 [Methanobrevibacter sp. 87.7]
MIDYLVNVFDGEGSVVVSDLAAGDYNVVANFMGNINYNASMNKTSFNVGKATPSIKVDATDITYGNDVIVNVNLNGINDEDLNGKVTVTIDGKDYTVNVFDGEGSVVVPGLAAGDYNVVASFVGNENYTLVSTNGQFAVGKANITSMNITVYNNDYGKDHTVNIELSGVKNHDVNGTVIITVDGKNYTVNIIDDRGSVIIPGLPGGEYELIANFTGNNNYNASVEEISFRINQATPDMYINVSNVTYGEDVVFDIGLIGINGTGLNGTVNVTIIADGKSYDVAVVDGKGKLNIPGLNAGTYKFSIMYNGNNNYTSASDRISSTVGKANVTEFIVSVDDTTYGKDAEINIKLIGVNGEALNDTIAVTVDGNDYTVPITNDHGSLDIPDLGIGKYDVLANFTGNNNYNASENMTSFNVGKATPSIKVDATDVTYDNDVVVNVGLNGVNNTGLTVTVTVDGNDYDVNVVDGAGSVVVPGLGAGDYNVVAKFAGNNNYNASENMTSFNVGKATPSIKVDATDVTYGEDVVVNVDLNGVNDTDLNGTVTVTINGKDYTVTIAEGKGTLSVPGLGAGEYDVVASFAGNENYTVISANSKVNVGKANVTEFIISVDDITYGEDAEINIKIIGVNSEALNGTVIVTVDGKSYDVTIDNGTGNLVVDGLFAKEYTVDSIFNGTKNYNPTNSSFNFTIDHLKPNLNVLSSVKGDSANITIKLTGVNGTGLNASVVVYVNNRYDIAVVDGVGYLVLDNLKNGQYNVNVVFNGDEIYSSIDANISFNIKYTSGNDANNKINTNDNINNVAVYGDDSSLVGNSDSSVSDLPKTGNPILVLLLVLSLIGIVVSRKK